MPQPSEHFSHPVLGTLGWLPEFSHCYGSFQLPTVESCEMVIDPGDDDRFGFLPRAAELFRWALDNQRQVLAAAIQAQLLEMYNDFWRQEDEPALSAAELTARLEWDLLNVKAMDEVPVEFAYNAGDLFGFHGVFVEVNADLQFRSIDLRG